MLPSLLVSLVALTAPGSDSSVVVHIETDHPKVELSRLAAPTAGLAAPVRLCGAPCDLKLTPVEGKFIVSGPGITQSDAFDFGTRRGDVTLRVRAGNGVLAQIGFGLGGVGGALIGFGAASLLIQGPFTDAAPAMLGTGVVAIAGGLVLALFNQTRVEFADSPTK